MKPDLDLITRFLGPDLTTYDPYDLWKTGLGLRIRKFYYENGKISVPIVGLFYLLDSYAPRFVRLFIEPQEFPIVRAFAVLSALNVFEITSENKYLDLAAVSAEWLVKNRFAGYNGACWGLGMPWMTKCGFRPASIPFISVVPYCVEALLKYSDIARDEKIRDVALTTLDFLEIDLKRLIDEHDRLALSYGPSYERRIVINGNAYAMMLYVLLEQRLPAREKMLRDRSKRICNFIISQQRPDGSWLYYADEEKGNFIDCFHSCFVMKNLVRYGKMTGEDVSRVVGKGIDYVLENFYDRSYGLARRFSLSANPSMAKFDLYDQAELLNLFLETGRLEQVEDLYRQIMKYFYIPSRGHFGYQIDKFGRLNKMLYLRWAVMPLIYVLSKYCNRLRQEKL